MAVRIICIKKDDGKYENPYMAIDHFEWINERINVKGVTDRSKIHDWIKDENGEAYIIDQKAGTRFTLCQQFAPMATNMLKQLTTKPPIAFYYCHYAND